MPAAVAGWIITATGVAATGLAAAAIHLGTALVFSYAVAKLTQPKGPSAKDLQTELRQSDAPRVRLLGRNRVAGASMFFDWRQVGAERVLFNLLAVGQGGISGVEKWWLGEKEVVVGAGGGVLGIQDPDGDPGDTVSDHPGPYYGGHVVLRWRSGMDAEVDGGQHPTLLSAFSQWTADHKLTGVGTILAEFDHVPAEDIPETYPGGVPPITALVRGDAQRHPDGVTWGHTDQLARQLYDIMVHPDYGWFAPAEMDTASWTQALADGSDDIALKNGGTARRYDGGGGYRLDEPLKDVAQRWLDGMAGQLFLTTEGKVGLRVGKWREPTYTITEDKLVAWEGGIGRGEMDVVTTLVPKYVAPETDYQETTADPWDDPLALARYGETIPKEMDLPVVQHHGQARRLAKIMLAKRNPRWRFTLKLRFWGLLLLEEEAVRVNLPRIGIVDQPFWIARYGLDMDGGEGVVTVSLIHARPESFDWDPMTEEGEPPAVADLTGSAATPPTITVVSVEVVTGSGDPYARVTLTQPVGETVVAQYRPTGSVDPWTTMLREGTGGSVRTPGLFDGQPIDVRLGIAKVAWSTTIVGSWTVIEDIDIVADPTGPDAPVVVSHSGAAGGPFEIVFAPDLGASYRSTKLYRAGPTDSFGAATVVDERFDLVSEVTLTGTVPGAGARYWLRSENTSGVTSPNVLVATYNP